MTDNHLSAEDSSSLENLLASLVVCNESHRFMVAEQLRQAQVPAGAILLYLLYNLSYSVFSWPAGWLSDKVGRRRVLVAGFLLYAAVYGGMALGPEGAGGLGSVVLFALLFTLYGLYSALTDGVAVLPIIGDITEKRANIIIQSTLEQSTRLSLRYLIVDLSGIVRVDESVIHHLISMVNMLKLIGVTPILTGIRPEHAVTMVHHHLLIGDVLVKNSLQAALAHIGFSLVENARN